MLFPVIGCFLALFPIATSVPPQTNFTTSRQFFGAYNLRDGSYDDILLEFNSTYGYSLYPQDFGLELSFPDVRFGAYNHNDKTYYHYNELTIEFNPASAPYWTITCADQMTSLETNITLYFNQPLSQQSDLTKNFTIYFPKYLYFDEITSNILNFFFTKELNQYHECYTGYYTFNNIPTGSFQLFGNVSSNNNLFNYLDYSSSYISFYYIPEANNYTLFELGKWNSSRSIYMGSVVLPNSLKNYMNERGVFAYIPQTELSDFQDLFFAIADTPIYFLTTWFNFSLLGFNVGIAITSLLTLLLIIFILRKLI